MYNRKIESTDIEEEMSHADKPSSQKNAWSMVVYGVEGAGW